MTRDEVLKRAEAYDYDAVRAYLEQGGNPEIYDREGASLLAVLLRGYYDSVFYSDPEEAAFLREHGEGDGELYRHVNPLCRVPLDKRPYGIRDKIDDLLARGIGINAVGWKEAEEEYGPGDAWVETPLFHAVVHCDYCMTEYLLEKGADPWQRLFSEGNYDEQEHEYWLLEHMDYYEDIGYCGEAGDNIRDMKALLNRYGLSWTKES